MQACTAWRNNATHSFNAVGCRVLCNCFLRTYSFPRVYLTACRRCIAGETETAVVYFEFQLELVRNLVAHGDAREGKWRGNWRMEWVASTLTPPPNVVYPTLLKLMSTPRLPAVDWTDAPTDLNGLVRFGEWRNLVSSRVPSRSARAIRLRTPDDGQKG